jgi:hypothetical protein
VSILGAGGIVGIVVAALVQTIRSGDGWYLFNRGTDWDAVRRRLGYEPVAPRSLPRPVPDRQRMLLGYWPLLTDWDEERVRLGYGAADATFPVIIAPLPKRGTMETLHRILTRLVLAWLVIVGGLMVVAAISGGLHGYEWNVAALVVFGPALFVGVLAWLAKPGA